MIARHRRNALAEAAFWIAGLVVVTLPDPAGEPWLSVCLFDHIGDWIGVTFCPGCGLGRSVAWLARGELTASLSMHPLGIPAVGVLVHHVFRLVRATGPAGTIIRH